jgi:hypothetical protein
LGVRERVPLTTLPGFELNPGTGAFGVSVKSREHFGFYLAHHLCQRIGEVEQPLFQFLPEFLLELLLQFIQVSPRYGPVIVHKYLSVEPNKIIASPQTHTKRAQVTVTAPGGVLANFTRINPE